MTRLDISYRRTVQGAWELSAIHNGYLRHRQYFGYTKCEAARLFRAEILGK